MRLEDVTVKLVTSWTDMEIGLKFMAVVGVDGMNAEGKLGDHVAF